MPLLGEVKGNNLFTHPNTKTLTRLLSALAPITAFGGWSAGLRNWAAHFDSHCAEEVVELASTECISPICRAEASLYDVKRYVQTTEHSPLARHHRTSRSVCHSICGSATVAKADVRAVTAMKWRCDSHQLIKPSRRSRIE